MNSADVVVAGTGIVGCLVAEQLLDAGLSVLMLDAGPRISRGRVTENYRNLPPMVRFGKPDAPFPPVPWAMHPTDFTGDPAKDYLLTTGPDAKAYRQTYLRYVGGSTWHWAGTLWRLTPEDMALRSRFGVGRDWPFPYEVLEPFYVRAERAVGAAGPSDPADQWPPLRSAPYPMEAFPFGSGQRRCAQAAESIGLRYIPCAQARNNGTGFQGRPPCSGNNNCQPICPIAARYDAYATIPRIEAKGGVVLANAVVHRVETGERNQVTALHWMAPDGTSTRVAGRTFVLACNGIETPKLLLLSASDRNPRGVANSSDQVGRNMMDTPKVFVSARFKDPVWNGLGPISPGAVMSTSQGAFRSEHAGGQILLVNFSTAAPAGLKALKQGLVGRALDEAIRREVALGGVFSIEHEVLPDPQNRLTLSQGKDALGLNKPTVRYDVGDYVRRGADLHTFPATERLARAMGAQEVKRIPGFVPSQHIMGGTVMGTDAATAVVDPDCRAHDHPNLFLPGGGAMPTGGAGNSTLTMAALALKAADAIVAQTRRA